MQAIHTTTCAAITYGGYVIFKESKPRATSRTGMLSDKEAW